MLDLLAFVWQRLDFAKMWSHFWTVLAKLPEQGPVRWATTADPLVVSAVVFILVSPLFLLYIIAARIVVSKMAQLEIKGKNILYVIAHPDDEAM